MNIVLPQIIQVRELKVKSKVIIKTRELYFESLIPYSGFADNSHLLGR
jgi:hypothetical protein